MAVRTRQSVPETRKVLVILSNRFRPLEEPRFVEILCRPDGTILEEIRPGYKVGGLVARHSEVLVSKRPAEKAKEEKKPEAPAEDKQG